MPCEMKPRRHPAVVASAHASLNMSCVYAEIRAATVVLPTRFHHACGDAFTRHSALRELTSHFLFQPIASSDLRPQHAPALRSMVADFEQAEAPREEFET